MYPLIIGLWTTFLLAAVFYVQRTRHPDQRPLAAYLIFVTVFTVTAFGLFVAATLILELAIDTTVLAEPLWAALFLIFVFVPAFFLGRWQLRKPPRARRRL